MAAPLLSVDVPLLQFLLDRIRERAPRRYDAYLVLDADNILDPNFVREITAVHDQGYGVVTCYRNSKNYGDNWISAGYALWFLREARYLNGARSQLRRQRHELPLLRRGPPQVRRLALLPPDGGH